MLHDPELESGVVRYLLTRGYAAQRCLELRPEDMAGVDNGRVLYAIQKTGEGGEQVTPDGVANFLVKRGHSTGPQVVRRLVEDAKKLDGVDGAITVLRDLAARRRLRDPLVRMAAMSEDGDLEELRSMVRAFAMRVDAESDADSESESFDTKGMIVAAMENFQAQKERPVVNLGPLRALAREMLPGHMVVVGGRSNAGKSQLAMMMGRRWWDSTKGRVGIVSVEDRAHVWGDRAIAYETGVSLMSGVRNEDENEFRDDEQRVRVTHDDMAKVSRAAAHLGEVNPFHLEVMDRSDIADVERAMLRCVRAQCEVIVVDYVQEIGDKSAQRGTSQHERYSGIAARIKMVAKRTKTRLILCSQVSRPQRGSNAEPTMTDLKGSGDIENMAEAIVLLWKEREDSFDTLAKVVKTKNGSERPRVVLRRNDGGMITKIERASAASRSGLNGVTPGRGR